MSKIGKGIALIICALLTLNLGVYSIAADEAHSETDFANRAFGHFLELLKIPRGSGHEQEASDYLVAFAGQLGLEAIQDEFLNVLIRKPGSQGRENEPPVVLQAHMDIVWEKNEDVTHDFLTDPITPVIDGDWIRAAGTTLGADNGAGLAMIMAVLESADLSHPPIEALFTTREELDMGGAKGFDVSQLTGRRFINLDGEDEKIFMVSCSSTNYITITLPVMYETVPDGYHAYLLSVSGLTGGHSGVDIDKNRANANVLMAELLNGLTGVYISGINGGSRRNAIPREAKAVLLITESQLDSVIHAINRIEHPGENNLTVTLEETVMPEVVMAARSAENLLDLILRTPNGVISMSPHIEGLVQTSNNLGVIETDGNRVILTNMLRSSALDEQESVIDVFEQLAEETGADILVDRSSPPWEFREDSPLRDVMTAIYINFFGREPVITAIHAGLECAVFTLGMPDGDFVAIGPDIFGAHSPDERMSISSFYRMCNFLAAVLENKTYDDITTGVRERFLRYVTHNTQSDPNSDTSPSTSGQTDFAKLLAEECTAIGLIDVTFCDFGIVMATLPANINFDVPVIGFIAHMDTAPDAPGANVIPRVHGNYDGGDIVLDHGTVISPDEFPFMTGYIGQTLITASGDTLLGADDKSGIAIILTAMEYLIQNPDIPRGKIRIAFTPDEEIGRGIENFDVEAFGADFAFTVDGGPLGELTYENFNAADASIEITGRSTHPGSAKGIMVNAALIAAEFVAAFPADEIPAATEGCEGFYHILSIEAGVESARIELIIRCFDKFEERKQFVTDLTAEFNERYGAGTLTLNLSDQYFNMKPMIEPWIIEYAESAFAAAGVVLYTAPARGGTDGAGLSYRGLPCPDIFTGMRNIHSIHEFISLETMVKAVEVIIELSRSSISNQTN